MKKSSKNQRLVAVLLLSTLCYVLPIQAQLNGQFSVSSSKKVRFSKGNLVYNCSSNTFSFASTQYAVIGDNNDNNITNKSGSIDLFGWGTSGYNSCMPYETSLSVSYGGGNSSIAGTQYDWGVKNFTNYRTLTNSEWSYLLSSRTNASSLRGPATVNGVKGWILLPDTWSKPSSITFTSSASGASTYSANVYTTSQFSLMENAGAVFLPAAGWRYSSGYVSSTSYVNSQGYYWSADKGKAVNFMGSYCSSGQSAATYSGCAVRLVYDTNSGGGGTTTQYTITTKVDPAGAGTVTGAGTYDRYKYITIQAYPNAGWEFVKFTAPNSPTLSYDNPLRCTVDRDNVITAHFQQKKYTVYGISNDNERGSVEPYSHSAIKGTTVTFKAVPKNGCRFVKWTDGVTTATRSYTIKGTEDENANRVVFYAEFESVNKFTLTPVSAQPERGTVSAPVTVDAGSIASARAYPKEGYKFVSWTLSNSTQTKTGNPISMYMYENVKATANFAALNIVKITVLAEPTDAGTVSGGGNYYEQSSVILSATSKPMKKFVRWEKQKTDGSWTSVSTNANYTFTATESATYRAVFDQAPTYTVSVSADETQGAVTITPEKEIYYENDTIVIKAIPAVCHEFTYWSDGNDANPRTIVLKKDIALTANFAENKVAFSAGSNNCEAMVRIIETGKPFAYAASAYVCEGEELTIEVQPVGDWFFVQWDDGNTENPRKIIVQQSKPNYTVICNKFTFGGYCGYGYEGAPNPTEDAWWSVDEYQNIKIEGKGRIYEFGSETYLGKLVSAAPWYSKIAAEGCKSTLEVGDSITTLPSYAFTGCYGIRKANLKHTGIKRIYNDAFTNTSLSEIVLPDSLTYLDNAVFMGTAIKEIILPEKLSYLGQNTFANCQKLKRVIFTRPKPILLKGNIWSWEGAGADIVYVPDGTRTAYEKAGYTNKSDYYMPFKEVVEWHRVTIDAKGPGICTADTTNYVGTGHTVSLTVQPDAGEQLLRLYVLAANGDTVELSDDYKFVMPESHVTVQAKFGQPVPQHTIRFLNWDGEVLQSKLVDEGTMPVYTGATPTKPDDDVYIYTFTGWTPEVVEVTGDADYTAQFRAMKKYATYYTIRFLNYDGTELLSTPVLEDELPVYTGPTPTHPDDTYNTYTFTGWSPDLVAATADADYTAQYTAVEKPEPPCGMLICDFTTQSTSHNNKYTDKWTYAKYWDILGGSNNNNKLTFVKMGGGQGSTANPVYVVNNKPLKCEVKAVKVTFPEGSFSQKGATCNSWGVKVYRDMACTQLLYTVIGETITGEAQETTIYAQANQPWSAGYAIQVYWDLTNPGSNGVVFVSKIEYLTEAPDIPLPTYYTIRFLNYDGMVLQGGQVLENTLPAYTGPTPTKPEDEQYTYTFTGWEPTIDVATANVDYTAQFTATEKPIITEPTYFTIRFVNYNGTVLQVGKVLENTMPVYAGPTPTKPDDDTYTYSFSGWKPTISVATANAEYKAQFTATEKPATPDPGAITVRLDPESANNWNAVYLYSWTDAGTQPCGAWPGTPVTKDADGWWSYTFDKAIQDINIIWSNGAGAQTIDITGVTSSTCYELKSKTGSQIQVNVVECSSSVTPDPVYYTIRFLNYDGTLLQSGQVLENTLPVYAGPTPTKPEDEQYTYAFTGWKPTIQVATANVNYTAQFTATEKPIITEPTYYSIRFLNYDGTELQSGLVLENTMPAYTGPTPTKPEDETYTYAFTGWNPSIVAATADADYTAQFTATEKTIIIPDPSAITVRLYPVSAYFTDEVSLYAWTENGTSIVQYLGSWPGTRVNKDAAGWWSYTFDPSVQNVNIIWNSSNSEMLATYQTVDIIGVTQSTCYRLNESTYPLNVDIIDCDTPVTEGIEEVVTSADAPCKILIDGQIYILRGDKIYTLTGQEVR